jgi:hypothetical protein
MLPHFWELATNLVRGLLYVRLHASAIPAQIYKGKHQIHAATSSEFWRSSEIMVGKEVVEKSGWKVSVQLYRYAEERRSHEGQ